MYSEIINKSTNPVPSTLATALDKTNDSITVYPRGVNATIINQQTAVTIGGGAANDTLLEGIVISKALTGTIVITGFVDQAAAARSITFPAATAAGTFLFGHAKNSAGALTVTCSNASDALNVIVKWIAA